MGKVVSRLVKRKINRFNVESRAHRILDQDKPAAAPKYASNIKDMERALEVDSKLIEKLNTKDNKLDDHLKQVYVTSQNTLIGGEGLNKDDPNRPLPLNRKSHEDFEYGFMEPQRVPIGRCSLRQALEFIIAHQTEPEQWTKTRIANEYKLKENLVENILFYFKSFSVHIPDERFNDKRLTPANAKQLENKEN